MKIFVDLDGVLCDWVGGVLDLFGKNISTFDWPRGEYRVWKALGLKNEDELWEPIDRHGSTFWATLDPYPWRDDLWEAAEAIGNACILSSPSYDPGSASGKTEWLQEWKGERFRKYALTPAKTMFAGPDSVLIDDSDEKIKAFARAGGRGILFPREWNSAYELAADPIKVVLRELRRDD